ncbi:WhiB family transcriptional regulator [Nocardia fusca]|uniref:WhiB family transcriptional regulator n=1 Tax=Nocardia fusca TaxID=941183 RepID=UPI0037C8D015
MTRTPNAGFPSIRRLAATLADDRLIGAECVGLAQMFDPRGKDEDDDDFAYRTTAAGKVCARCPVQASCATVATELAGEAVGVWAGQIRNTDRPRGRPRKTA